MTVFSNVTNYVIPRPLTDVFYNGYKVYCFPKGGEARNVEQQRSCAEKMIKTLLRIAVAVPLAFVNFQVFYVWKWDHIKNGLVYHFIVRIATTVTGCIISVPSAYIALSSAEMIASLIKCAQLYPYPRLRAFSAFYCAFGIFLHYLMQTYDSCEKGILDAQIQSWAKNLSKKYFPS